MLKIELGDGEGRVLIGFGIEMMKIQLGDGEGTHMSLKKS